VKIEIVQQNSISDRLRQVENEFCVLSNVSATSVPPQKVNRPAQIYVRHEKFSRTDKKCTARVGEKFESYRMHNSAGSEFVLPQNV
jgi:hypothetical protein